MAHLVQGNPDYLTNGAPNTSQIDYPHLVDQVPGVIWEADADTLQYTFVSKHAEDLLGYPIEQWTIEPEFRKAHTYPEDRARLAGAISRIVGDKDSLQADYRMIAADGRMIWVRDIMSPVIENDVTVKLCGILSIIPQVAPRDDSLLEKEEQYRRIFDVTSDGLMISDMEGCVAEVNSAFAAMHGYTPEEMVGMNVRGFAHPDRHNYLGEFFSTIEAGNQIQLQSKNIRKDGSFFDVEVHGVPFLYNGTPHSLAIIRDITERVQAYELLEERMADRTQELSTLLEVSANLASAMELEPLLERILFQLRNVVEYSRATITIFNKREVTWETDNVSESNVVSMSAWGDAGRLDPVPVHATVMLLDDTELGDNMRLGKPTIIPDIEGTDLAVQDLIRLSMSKNDQATIERLRRDERCMLYVPLAQGHTTAGGIVLRHPQPDYYNERHAQLAMGIAHQAAIAIENGHLMVQAHEKAALEERQRLARELHDSVTQSLFSINLIARSVEMMIQREGNHSNDTLEKMVDLRQLTQGALAEMRALIFELRPGALEEEGLLQAIRKHAAAVEGRDLLKVEVIADDAKIPRLKPAAEEALYRIAQESLHNIVKHSRANKVEIALRISDYSHVMLSVVDDGIGFTRSEVPAGHMGLGTMTQRAAALGGQCVIESAPGKGTRIEVRLPLPEGSR